MREIPSVGHTFVSDVREMRDISNKGSRYVVTFVDRKSRLVRVYFLRKKSEVLTKAKHFINWVKTQRGNYPKNFHSDGGGEYISKNLQEFLEELGINFEQTEAYTPTQNGIAERINRTLVEGTYASLRHANLPAGFWEEAMQQFVYIKNRTPHTKLGGERPIDIWNEDLGEVDRVDVWDVHPFGCRAEVWIPPSRRTGGKDGPRTRTCAYLGKAVGRKADAFWDYERDKIIFGHSDHFYDDQFPKRPKALVVSSQVKKGILKPAVTFGGTTVMEQVPADVVSHKSRKKGANDSSSSDSSSSDSSDELPLSDAVSSDSGSNEVPLNDAANHRDVRGDSESQTRRRSGRARNQADYTKGQNLRTKMRNLNGKSVDAGYLSKKNALDRGDRIQALLAKTVQDGMKHKEKITRKSMLKREDKDKFIEDEMKEIESGFRTGCIEQVEEVPETANLYHVMWVYKVKPATELEGKRYRSRMCVLGNKQRPDSYGETFAAVGKVKMFRMLLTLCVHYGLKMTQLDVSNAFMYADLDKEIYIHPPQGYRHLGPLKLNKSLYGLKQAPRLWYETMKAALEELGYKQLQTDVCCFTHPTERCYVLMYVDDICIATANSALRKQLVKHLQEKFKVKHFEEAKRYVGLQLHWSKSGEQVKVFQQDYIEKVLDLYNMSESKTKETPTETGIKLSRHDEKSKNRPYRELVGSLLYTLGSRPDVACAIRMASQCVQWGADKHWHFAKAILRYLKGTKKKGVVYEREEDYYLTAYCDSDFASEEDRKSVSGYVIFAQGGPVVWKSKKQPTVALSSCEAEYVALSETIKELLWMSMALTELNVKQDRPIRVYIDNQAAQRIAENAVNHERTKHIDTRYHFIRQVVAAGKVELCHIDTKENVSDLLTKSTTRKIFAHLVGAMIR